MSLNYSPWLNDDQIRKRIPTMKNSSLAKNNDINDDKDDIQLNNDKNDIQLNNDKNNIQLNNDMQINNSRNNKVSDLLEKITNIKNEDTHNNLSDFTPIPNPILNKKKTMKPIITNNIDDEKFSNYSTTYNDKPYYSKMGINSSDPIIEKLNYMIHLLEENQSEKTNNISEEFILYTLVGVFIIYIVDSFSRNGKYTRM
jgi:hypothetical protein